jgi:L-gulonolactone oxidase
MKATSTRWRNWAGNQECLPGHVHEPSSEDELAAIVKRASAAGERVKMAGAGHSFTGAALTDGHHIRPRRYGRVLHMDRATGLVTVQAGMTLSALNGALATAGLALPNLGDIAYQTVAGAISTATHGTGERLGNLATQVRALRLLTGDGSIVECSAEEEPEVFAAARVGVGALGLISTATLATVPAFDLHVVEEPLRLDAVLEALDDHVGGADHFEFYWVPHTGWALTKTNNRTQLPRAPRPRWRAFRDDVLLSNVAFGAVCRLGRLRPAAIPRLARALPGTGRMEYVDRSDRVFASPRYVRFTEMEYAVPREAAVEVVRELRAMVKRSGLMISFPVEVRFVSADDIPLSPSYGRETCYVAVHMYQGMDNTQYFTAVEDIMRAVGGRPHWGKLHFQTAETLAPRYPRWDDAQAVRRRLDPEGTFANTYTDRVLGRVASP